MTRKSQRKLIKKKRLFVLRPKTNHGWCRPALFDLVKGPFISKRISFSFAIKKTGKKSNTQKRAMYIVILQVENKIIYDQNVFFKKKYIYAFQSDETIFLKIWLNGHMITLSTFLSFVIYICIVSPPEHADDLGHYQCEKYRICKMILELYLFDSMYIFSNKIRGICCTLCLKNQHRQKNNLMV